MFSSAEALGLVMAVLDGHHDAGDPSDPVGSALGKIVRALPSQLATQVEAVRRTTAPAPDRAAARPDPGITTGLVQACNSARSVRLSYRSEAGSEWDIDVDPWAVVVRHGRWYLLCRSHSADARRAYRIDRVRSWQLLDGTFVVPGDLDPVAVLEEHLAVGWEYEVEVVIEAAVDKVARACRVPSDISSRSTRLTCRLVGSTSNPWWYAEQLAAIPAHYRILRGPELQATARSVGRRLLEAGEAAGNDPA